MTSPWYGLTLGIRAASMEEAVKRLTASTSSSTVWPYALVRLHKGTSLPGGSANLRSANSSLLAPKSSAPWV